METKYFVFTFFLLLLSRVEGRPTKEIERRDNFDERGKHLGGDVILPPGFDLNNKNGLIGDNLRWPNATLIYTLDVDFTAPELTIINDAMREIEAQTCIKFQERNGQAAYIFVARGGPGSGCYSFLGRLGGPQQLNLQAPGCVHKGIVIHEFVHAIGFYHEQSREDRDDYVSINWSNIEIGTEFNFLKASASLKYNVTYDYNSLMHYSAYSFAADPSIPTIIPNDPDAEIGQRIGLSAKDIYKINAMYCPEENGEIPE